MAVYLYELSYTPESISAQLKNPQDRMEAAARPVVESIGGKLLGGGFAFGEFDAAFMIEAPDDESAAAISLAVTAGGAVKTSRTTKLLTGAQWVEALQKAGTVAKAYKPSR
jgi:uncharacterized protein with GYD domain